MRNIRNGNIQEMTFRGEYDYGIVNDDLNTAVADFLAVVRAIELTIEQ